jgi:hypothetical protein
VRAARAHTRKVPKESSQENLRNVMQEEAVRKFHGQFVEVRETGDMKQSPMYTIQDSIHRQTHDRRMSDCATSTQTAVSHRAC